MKNRLFMYLFLFALLFIIYQYMNEKSIFERQENKIESLRAKLNQEKISVDSLQQELVNLNYFTLQGNDNAMSYFENLGYKAIDIEQMVSDNIYDQNLVKGNNPLVPYEGLNGAMKINKLKFLNHKWIIADYTDGTYWGEMLLEFYIDDNKSLTLSNLGSLLYTTN
ncbi:MAG: hypothetical protein ACI9SJ_000682 [Flavobacteriaceae bacterium]|jgi:hypothetical protein|uniref:hydrolase n=1 Tax=Candidatus Marifrigoribacter sp. Uisw_064 TaxID=3230970 RepID=UPI003AE3CF7B